MRKILFILLLLVFSLGSISAYAADLSFGGGVALSRTKSGGYGEFGATLYKNNSFEMRNYLSIDGYGNISTDYNIGYLGFTEKITFLTKEIEKIVYNEASLYYVTPIINSARLLNKTLSKDFKNFQILGRKIGSEKKRRNFFIIFLSF